MAKKYRRAYVYSCNPVTREEIDKLGLDAEECWVSPDIVENPDGKAKTMYIPDLPQIPPTEPPASYISWYHIWYRQNTH